MKHEMPVAEPREHGVVPCPTAGSGPNVLDRWDVLSVVTALRRHLGLTDRDVMVLRAHLSVLPHGPLRPDGLNMSFMNLSEIQERACGMDERRFRRGEVRLEEVGLIRRNLSANGRRFPERDRSGAIVAAYGIDLSPLLSRFTELEERLAILTEEERHRRHRRNALSARMSAIVRSYGIASLPENLVDLRDALRNALRRKHPSDTELAVLERQLEQAETALNTDITVPEDAASPDKTPADAGQTVLHIEPKPKDQNDMAVEDMDQVWRKTTTLREFYTEAPATARTAWRVLTDFASFLTVKRDLVERMIAGMGWIDTVRHLDALATGIDRIKRPGSYLETILASTGQGVRGQGIRNGHRRFPVHGPGLPG